MIARLRGVIDFIGDGHLILDVNGVGYMIFASAKTLARIGEIGTAVSLLIETHVREDHIHLYGFADADEKAWFQLLCTVQGVGTKVALAVLSVASPQDLAMGIAAQDKAMVNRADGVGPKLATRIVTELKDKAGKMALGNFPQAGRTGASAGGAAAKSANSDNPFAGIQQDAVSALVNLGYNQTEAFRAVGEVIAANSDEGAIELGKLIRDSLKQLSAA